MLRCKKRTLIMIIFIVGNLMLLPLFQKSLVCSAKNFQEAKRKTLYHTIKKHHSNPRLVSAIITVESNWKADAVSNRGAVGLMQVMPSSAKMVGLEYSKRDLMVPHKNIEAGCKILKMYQNKTNTLAGALHKYSGGARDYYPRVKRVMASL